MADVTISYKGNTIASKTDNGTVTLDTAGTFCEQDITVDVYDEYYTPTEDATPYLYRTTAGSEDVGGKKKVEKLVGGTVNWNQLVNQESAVSKTFNADTTLYYGTITSGISVNYIGGHKYYIGLNCTRNISTNNFLRIYLVGSNGNVSVIYENGDADGWKYAIGEANQTATSTGYFYNNYSGKKGFSSGDSITINNSMAVDLTAMFGTTIADYIYTLEQGTAGAGIEWLQSYGFFTKPYYPYNAGELVSVKTSASVTRGRNIFDQSLFDTDVGNTVTYQSYAVPNGTYTMSTSDFAKKNNVTNVFFLNGQVSSGVSTSDNGVWTEQSRTITVTDGYYTIAYRSSFNSNSQDPADFHWQIEYGDTAHDYVEYTAPHSYPLQSTDLRGILSLDSSNNLTYTGDEYAHEGVVTRNFAVVDLGTLTWSYNSNYGFMGATLSGLKSWTRNSICQAYVNSLITSVSLLTDKKYYMTGTDIRIMDTDYTDATTFTSAMSGVYLVYELATATTESANPFTELQTISNLGTEQFVDGRTVEMPVGHQTLYNEPRSTDTLKS